ncbi:histidinol-phosphate transaminase [uncultured Microscilla sp.]|uniref:histidinol-phosphate transaminase n=1 Tax=uncultured Microscilla sp. TaxID=432653 RepID=UPI002628D4AD|nr:histidinol-phosphate transaminase [uncultured Microscilla sp.]
MKNIEKLVRPNIWALKPYSSARDEFVVDDEGNEQPLVFLDANENPLGSVGSNGANNRYPDPYQRKLKEALSTLKNVAPENIFLGNGSDEAIDLLFRIFCTPGQDRVLVTPPTYGMYQVSADINHVAVDKVILNEDFTLPVAQLLDTIGQQAYKLLILCNPNNPTGNAIASTAEFEQILQTFEGVVVVDEAYIDFADFASMTALIDRYPNLVVLQTFSKAWGLANLRLGMAFASPLVIDLLNKVKPPYNLNGITQELGLQAVQNVAQKNTFVANIRAQRDWLYTQLPLFDFIEKVFPSQTNFILFRTQQPNKLYQYLVQHQVIVRNRSTQPLCEGCLRVSVGTEAENKRFIELLASS